MKKFVLSALVTGLALSAQAQFNFPVQIQTDYSTTRVQVPASPLRYQILFIGGYDSVATVDNQGRPNGRALAKQWHDFIGFTPDNAPGSQDLGWVTVNHEMIQSNDKIGDGGGMTAFKVRRGANDTLLVVPQTLNDGRSGRFFNVDFANTVGQTGMNCGGIVAPDGRIWTAEEWMQTSNRGIFSGGSGIRDTSDFTISTTIPGNFNGRTLRRFQNLNWMVEIDPRQARAIRKQYNWGRLGFEGGVVAADNRTVYMSEDNTPAIFTKFVANTAGDFTSGRLFAYKHDATGSNGKWVELTPTSVDSMLNCRREALRKGASMFNRLEWSAQDPISGKIYITETGRDDLNFSGSSAFAGTLDNHWVTAYRTRFPNFTGSDAAALDSVRRGRFRDYYGRVLEFDPATENIRTYIEGGPFLAASPDVANYPSKHLSNPDGLSFIRINNRSFMVIQEDLNGTSFGRMPSATAGPVCEVYLLDMTIANPTINDLIRISATPAGAEVTGAIATPDGKTLLLNSQHPPANIAFPYNNSLTYAITGFDQLVLGLDNKVGTQVGKGFTVYPNPAAREINFNKVADVAIYDAAGKRVKVARQVEYLNISDLNPGTYFMMTDQGETARLVVE